LRINSTAIARVFSPEKQDVEQEPSFIVAPASSLWFELTAAQLWKHHPAFVTKVRARKEICGED
jgi:hypothetical protein